MAESSNRSAETTSTGHCLLGGGDHLGGRDTLSSACGTGECREFGLTDGPDGDLLQRGVDVLF